MGWIGMIVTGFFVGLLARWLKPGDDKAGFILTVIFGILGSVLATKFGEFMGWYLPMQKAGFLMSIAGAIAVILIYGFIKKALSVAKD